MGSLFWTNREFFSFSPKGTQRGPILHQCSTLQREWASMEGDQSCPHLNAWLVVPPTPILPTPLRQTPAPFPLPPFLLPLLPSASLRADVSLAAVEDMETISSSSSARPGRSLGSQHSPAKASSKIMFLGASTQNHLENMRDCSLTTQPHSQHCPLAPVLSLLGLCGEAPPALLLSPQEMTRIRVGIGRPEGEVTVSSYVLAPFSAGEQERLEQVLAQAVTCLLEHILWRRAPAGEPGDRG